MLRDKKSIIKHYEQSLIWVKDLRNLSEEQWRKPIESGKWSVAEMIGHLTPWDTFVLEHRIPYLFIYKYIFTKRARYRAYEHEGS